MGKEIYFCVDGEQIPITVEQETIYEFLGGVFLEDYGIPEKFSKKLLKRIYKDFHIDAEDFPLDESYEDLKEEPKNIIKYFDLDEEIYEKYYDDYLDELREYIRDNDLDDYREQVHDYFNGDSSPDGFSSFEAFKDWQNGRL